MRIKIEQSNAAAIEKALSAVAGKKTRCIHQVSDVISAAQTAERKLEEFGLQKTCRAGATAQANLAGPGKSYGYSFEGTSIALQRLAAGWYLTDVTLQRIYPGGPERMDILIETSQIEAALQAKLRNLRISARTPAPTQAAA
ncbi:hypothetical protein [Cereibacter sphaeroides]|uniref:hypothetical protein n=1 Tax=Cereibacter sphaeroides TaxID=1063 RepID=UPI003FCE43AF